MGVESFEIPNWKDILDIDDKMPDGYSTLSEIAEELGLSERATRERINKKIKDGIIEYMWVKIGKGKQKVYKPKET